MLETGTGELEAGTVEAGSREPEAGGGELAAAVGVGGRTSDVGRRTSGVRPPNVIQAAAAPATTSRAMSNASRLLPELEDR